MTSKNSRIPVAWMKVYDSSGGFRASVVHPEDAAALVAVLGEGAQIRNGHAKKSVLWTEGDNGIFASESYDLVAEKIIAKMGWASAPRHGA